MNVILRSLSYGSVSIWKHVMEIHFWLQNRLYWRDAHEIICTALNTIHTCIYTPIDRLASVGQADIGKIRLTSALGLLTLIMHILILSNIVE